MKRSALSTFLAAAFALWIALPLVVPSRTLAQAPPVEDEIVDPAGAATPAPDLALNPGTLVVDAERCEKTNTSLWISIGSIHAGALILFFALWWLFNRKNWASPGFPRFLAIALPLGGVCAAVLALFRPQAEIVAQCLASADFNQLILFGDLAPWLRGVSLGFAPSIVVMFLAMIAAKVVEKLR